MPYFLLQENVDHSQAETPFNRGPRVVSLSAPLLADKKFEPSERIKQMQPSSTRKFHTYVLPTPTNVKSSDLTGSGTSVSAPPLERKVGGPTQLWHSSPLQPNMLVKEFRDDELSSPTRLPKEQLVLQESSANSGPIRMHPPLSPQNSKGGGALTVKFWMTGPRRGPSFKSLNSRGGKPTPSRPLDDLDGARPQKKSTEPAK